MSSLADGAALFASRHGDQRASAATTPAPPPRATPQPRPTSRPPASALSAAWQAAVDKARTRFANDPDGFEHWLQSVTDPTEGL
jgi:hypothetical protein